MSKADICSGRLLLPSPQANANGVWLDGTCSNPGKCEDSATVEGTRRGMVMTGAGLSRSLFWFLGMISS